MVFNICALIATTTLIHDKVVRKVTSEHIKTSLAYVMKKCYSKKKKRGGAARNEQDEYGSNALYEQMRSDAEIIENTMRGGGISVFTVIFTKMTPDKELFRSRFIKELLIQFDVTISDSSMKELKKVLKLHLSCLLTDLKNSGAKLTPTLVDKVIKMKRHAVFL
jgi:hypothetical protein